MKENEKNNAHLSVSFSNKSLPSRRKALDRASLLVLVQAPRLPKIGNRLMAIHPHLISQSTVTKRLFTV